MSSSNKGNGSSGSKPAAHQGSNSGTERDNMSQQNDKGVRAAEKQQSQESSKQKAPVSTRGGTHEQHVKAGEQSHKKN